MTDFRTERDSMGDVQLPAQAYYGSQTQRAVENFPISGRSIPADLIHAMGLVKWAAATANRDLGLFAAGSRRPLSDKQIESLLSACLEVAAGRWDGQFPVDVFQTGSGTSSNMNANEVIANRAIELCGGDRFAVDKAIHPNDHVNMGQSTNDTFPTAIHVAVATAIEDEPGAALCWTSTLLSEKAFIWEQDHQDRPHTPCRRHAAGPRPGDRRPGLAVGHGGRPRAARHTGHARAARRRHGRGQRHQHPSRSSATA